MAGDVATWLLHSVFALSAGILLVLALRHAFRRHFGPRVAYALWLLPPATMFAVWLPAPLVDSVRVVVLDGLAHSPPTSALGPIVPPSSASSLPTWALLAWAVGVVVMSALMAGRHRRFANSLGALRRLGHRSYASDAVDGLPALVGLWRPRIVLPADFNDRYCLRERSLMIAHERAHLRRGDPWSNAGVALIQCAFWFNPLVHFAAGRLRHDQELACDAAVLSRRPGEARVYAEAMLKTRLADHCTPLACHWGTTHPLKERIQMLKLPAVSSGRRVTGTLAVACAIATLGTVAWAAQPPTDGAATSAPRVEVTLAIEVDGHESEIRGLQVGEGEEFIVESAPDQGAFSIRFVVQAQGEELYLLSAEIRDAHTDELMHSPQLVSRAGSEFGISMAGDSDRLGFAISGMIARAHGASPAVGSLQSPGPAGAPLPSYNAMTAPDQPRDAADAPLTGTVLLEVLVGADGAPLEIAVNQSSGHPALDAAASEAVEAWSFNPAISDGEPVAARVMVPMRFASADDAGEAEAIEGALDTLTVRSAE